MVVRTLRILPLLTALLLAQPAWAVSDIHGYSTTAGSNTDIGGVSVAENAPFANMNNALRELMAELRRAVANQGSDIASAATTEICDDGTSVYAKVTGTTTITSLGTANAGCWRIVTFTGALTLTHNATSLILPAAVNITTAAGDVMTAVSEGSGNWRVVNYQRAGTEVHKLWIPAAAMRPRSTGGPASADVQVSSVEYYVLDFDASTAEFAHFNISMPSSWNEGTVTFVPVWTAASGSGDVIWRLRAVSVSNDDVIENTYSNSTTSTDTLIAAADLHRGPESSALTIDGTPAANDTVFFRVDRFASDAGDTLATDARLIGIELYITTNAATDAP